VRFCISSRDARDITLVDRARASASAAFCAASFSLSSASAFSFLRIALAYSLSKTAAPPLGASASVAAGASFCLAFAASLAASFCANDLSRLCFPGPAPKTYFRYAGARRSESSPATSRSAPALAGRRFPKTTSVRSKACSAELWNCLDFSYLSSGGRAAELAGRRAASHVADAGRRAAAAAAESSRRRSASAAAARALAFARASFALSAALASSVSVEAITGFAVTGRPWRAARSRRRDLSRACSSFTARGTAMVAEKPLAWQKSRATCVGSSRGAISMRSNRPPPKSTSTAAMAFLAFRDGKGVRVRGRARCRGARGAAMVGEFPESGRDAGQTDVERDVSDGGRGGRATRARPAASDAGDHRGEKAAGDRHALGLPERPHRGRTACRAPDSRVCEEQEWGQSARPEFPEPRLARARGAFSARRPRRCTRQRRCVRGQQRFVRCARSGECSRRPGVLETNWPPVRDRNSQSRTVARRIRNRRVLVC
jgi:hypothetical protein